MKKGCEGDAGVANSVAGGRGRPMGPFVGIYKLEAFRPRTGQLDSGKKAESLYLVHLGSLEQAEGVQIGEDFP